MISFRQFRRFFVMASLTLLITSTVTITFAPSQSWAATTFTKFTSQPQIAMNRVDAISKDIEGKTQELKGNITGDPQDQFMGKAKQVQSDAINVGEDIKDNMNLKGRSKAVSKNIEGKAQELKGNLTGDRKDQIVGKAKQTESEGRNVVENLKDKVQNIFN